MRKGFLKILWAAVALLGGAAFAVLAVNRGEAVSSIYVVIAAVCTYAIGYRFYSKWIATKVLMVNDRRATPCEVHEDGHDFVKTNKWIVFGHHFAAIAGPGPLVGPVLAAQFGYLPGLLWILIGVVLGGAVQDFVILFCSLRRDGKSLGQMVKEELSGTAGIVAMLAILSILVILLAVLGLVVVKALAESPWGVFTVTATLPIALLMGVYLRYWRIGKVLEASLLGMVLLALAIWGGKLVHLSPTWKVWCSIGAIPLAWAIIVYGFLASIVPVWLLLAPRDYLSTFVKLGTIVALAFGIMIVWPRLHMPQWTPFIDGTGPVVAGKLFPFCFITIACGAVSGFHTLIASGTTPKLLTREAYARPVGYGAMCLESLVAVMALVAACTMDPGVYFSVNMQGEPQAVVEKVTGYGFPIETKTMDTLASQMGEHTLFGRTGGAATFAVGMAQIFSSVTGNRGLDLWYHFAVMFEALFILTTLDAGTRVGRYLLQDLLGYFWKPFQKSGHALGGWVASALMVAAWGYFLIQGVKDPLGGINSLWPLFGIANQLLAAIALCLGTTVILKMHIGNGSEGFPAPAKARPWMAFVTLVPLVWLLTVTLTAGGEKIFHPNPRIGFLAAAKTLDAALPKLESRLLLSNAAESTAIKAEIRKNRVQRFNANLDAVVTGFFLAMVILIVLLSIREWLLILGRRAGKSLQETPPVWLPDYALSEGGRLSGMSFGLILFALARELSGEASQDREMAQVAVPVHEVACQNGAIPCKGAAVVAEAEVKSRREAYDAVLKERHSKINRCC